MKINDMKGSRSITYLSLACSIIALVLAFLTYKGKTDNKQLAYVDMIAMLNGYEGMKTIKKQVEEKQKGWKADEDTLVQQFQAELKDYEAKQAKMNEKEKQQARQQLQLKQQQYSNYQQFQNKKNEEEVTKLKQQTLEELNEVIKEIGKQQNYQLILAAGPASNLLYAQEGINITDEVLKQANNLYNNSKK